MNIKAAYINEGIVCGDVSEILNADHSTSYVFDKPVLIQPSQKGLILSQILGFFEEDQLTIRDKDLRFGQLFTLASEIADYYKEQIHPKSIITPPSGIFH